MKNFLILLLLLFPLSANAQSFLDNFFKKTYYTSDIDIKYESGEYCAYYDDKRFTGKVNSLDENCYMEFKNGIATKAVGYHPTGKVLFTAEFPYDERIIWIYSKEGKGLIKARYQDGEWNYYNMLKPDEKGFIPWIRPEDCVKMLGEYYISLSMIESCFDKLPRIGEYIGRMPRKYSVYNY